MTQVRKLWPLLTATHRYDKSISTYQRIPRHLARLGLTPADAADLQENLDDEVAPRPANLFASL